MATLSGLFTPTLGDAAPFHLRMKTHLLLHLALDMLERWGSPRLFWCYGDESFVGTIKKIAGMSRHPARLEYVVLSKARLYAALHEA